MVKYKMKFFGSSVGIITGIFRSFDKDQIMEVEEGEFSSDVAERISELPEEKKETRGRKPKNQKSDD